MNTVTALIVTPVVDKYQPVELVSKDRDQEERNSRFQKVVVVPSLDQAKKQPFTVAKLIAKAAAVPVAAPVTLQKRVAVPGEFGSVQYVSRFEKQTAAVSKSEKSSQSHSESSHSLKNGMRVASIIEKKEEVNDYNSGTVTYVHPAGEKREEHKSVPQMAHHPSPPTPISRQPTPPAPHKTEYQPVEYGY